MLPISSINDQCSLPNICLEGGIYIKDLLILVYIADINLYRKEDPHFALRLRASLNDPIFSNN